MPTPLVSPSVSLSGRTAVVTGANTGIGLVTAIELARAGARVVLACRNREKTESAIATLQQAVPGAEAHFLALDLGSLASVRGAVDALRGGPRVDLLINNAGLAAKGLTKDGFENVFGVNHFGHFALTVGLEEHLVDGGRVVTVASRAHFRAPLSAAGQFDWEALRRPTASVTGFAEYAGSKLANVLFSRRLATRLAPRGIDCYSLHPGVVASDIWRDIPQPFRWLAHRFMLTTEEGARTSLYCATAAEAKGKTGEYWDKCEPRKASRAGRDDAFADELWERSAKLIAAA